MSIGHCLGMSNRFIPDKNSSLVHLANFYRLDSPVTGGWLNSITIDYNQLAGWFLRNGVWLSQIMSHTYKMYNCLYYSSNRTSSIELICMYNTHCILHSVYDSHHSYINS